MGEQASAAGYAQTRFKAPEDATEVLMIRHGQSAPMTADGPFPMAADGQADPELSTEGQQQAKLLAERLAGVACAALYVSTLVRTHQTAAPLVERTGLVPQVDPDLREVYLGDWEGGEFRRRAQAKDPLMRRIHLEGTWSLIPNAEPAESFAERVGRALRRLHGAHSGQRIAVVCHGGVIGQAVSLATGASPMAFAHVDNTSITQLFLREDHWIVRRVNDAAHLGPHFPPAAEPVI